MAEAPTPNLLAISAIEIPASRLKSHAILGKDSRSRRFRYLADSRKRMLAVLAIPQNRGSLDAANHHMMKGPGCIQSRHGVAWNNPIMILTPCKHICECCDQRP
jgi:hypothetical protein